MQLMFVLEDFYNSAARILKPIRRHEDNMPDRFIFVEPVRCLRHPLPPPPLY
jgi:hypothetical protein